MNILSAGDKGNMAEPHPNSVSPGEAQSVGQRAPAGSSLSSLQIPDFLGPCKGRAVGRAAEGARRWRGDRALGFQSRLSVPPPRVPRPLRPGTGYLDELSSPQGQSRNATSEQARSSQDLNSTKQLWSENVDSIAV